MRYRRDRHHQSQLNLLASKRITVAVCAAIAMVLGAMSVGATFHVNLPLAESAEAGQTETANRSNSSERGQDPGSENAIPDYTYPSKQLLSTTAATLPIQTQPVFKGSSKSKSLANINLGPITALVENKQIKLDVSLPVETPLPPIEVTIPVPLPDVTEPQTPPAEETTDPEPEAPTLQPQTQQSENQVAEQ